VSPSKSVAATKEIHPALAELLANADDDQDNMAWSIAERILAMEDPDDILSAGDQQTLSVEEDFMGKPFMLHRLELRRSRRYVTDNDAPDNVFGLFWITVRGSNEEQLLTCGAVNVLAQAWNLQKRDALPRMVEVYSAEKATAAGFHPLWLRAPKVVTLDDGSEF
jgi:hypothetical protein